MSLFEDAKQRVDYHLLGTGDLDAVWFIVDDLYEYDEEEGELLREYIYEVYKEYGE